MNKWLSCGIRCISYFIGLYFLCFFLSLYSTNVPYQRFGRLVGFLFLVDIFLTFISKNGKLIWGKKKGVKEDKIVYVDEISEWDNKKKK